MSISFPHAARLGSLTLALAAAALVLPGCRRPEAPPVPTPPSDVPAPKVAPSTDLKGASDHADAPPAVGSLTGGDQASGGARSGAVQPTAGDGAASTPASGASR
ncbi:MAG: hypothetical protein JNL93_12900 [Pelomonas sp.]|nr:hypothetical protein [Roseateles sp.]